MRLHKSEAAFFVFIAVILMAGALTLHAYGVLTSLESTIDHAERGEVQLTTACPSAPAMACTCR